MRNGRTLGSKHPARLLVLPKIRLGADKDERRVFAEMRHFGVPLGRCKISALPEREGEDTPYPGRWRAKLESRC